MLIACFSFRFNWLGKINKQNIAYTKHNKMFENSNLEQGKHSHSHWTFRIHTYKQIHSHTCNHDTEFKDDKRCFHLSYISFVSHVQLKTWNYYLRGIWNPHMQNHLCQFNFWLYKQIFFLSYIKKPLLSHNHHKTVVLKVHSSITDS